MNGWVKVIIVLLGLFVHPALLVISFPAGQVAPLLPQRTLPHYL